MHHVGSSRHRDGAKLHLILGAASAHLTTRDVERLIQRSRQAARAKMTPVVPAEPPDDPARLHQSDNLLWSVQAVPQQ